MKKGLYKHPILGSVKVYINSQHVKIMQYDPNSSTNPSEIQSFKEILSTLSKYKPIQYILLPLEIRSSNSKSVVKDNEEQSTVNNIFTSFYSTGSKPKNQEKFIYEYFPITLRQEILNRAKHKRVFSFNQISHLLYHLVGAGQQILRINQYVYGNSISTDSILLNEFGEIRIIQFCSGTFLTPKQHYEAPQNINFCNDFMQSSADKQNADCEKTDETLLDRRKKDLSICFSFGMIAAGLMMLREDCSCFYDEKNGHFLRQYFWSEFNKVKYQSKNKHLWSIVALMLETDLKKRVTLGEVNAILDTFIEKVLQNQKVVELKRKDIEESIKCHLTIKKMQEKMANFAQ